MNNMILSIIVPAYNVEKYILKLLNSIFESNADQNKYEILIIDDGAKDNTIEVVSNSKYSKKPNLRLIHKENGGHGSVINYGISIAKGRYLRVIDGDDWINTDQFEHYLDTLEKSHADLFVDTYYKCYMDSNKNEKCSELFDKIGSYYGPIETVLKQIDTEYFLMPMITIRTSIIKGLEKKIDEKIFYDDAEYNALCIACSSTVEIVDFSIYQYRLGRMGQSVDISVSVKRTDDKIKVIRYVFDIIDELKSDIYKTKYLERYISKTACNCLGMCISAGRKSNKSYKDMVLFDKEIKQRNINVYELMEDVNLNGKKIKLFRRFGRVFCLLCVTMKK